MKIKVTVMTENDKHLDESYSKDEIESKVRKAWQIIFDMMLLDGDDPSEKITVESCELVER